MCLQIMSWVPKPRSKARKELYDQQSDDVNAGMQTKQRKPLSQIGQNGRAHMKTFRSPRAKFDQLTFHEFVSSLTNH